jgi:sensor histidine kinase YesM
MTFKETYLKGLKKDLFMMLGVSFLIGAALCLPFYLNGNGSWRRIFLISAHGAIISFFLWFGNSLIVDFLNFRFSWFKQAKQRVILGVVGSIAYTIPAFFGLQICLMHWFHGVPIKEAISDISFSNLIFPITITALITMMAHLIAFFNQWRKAELEKEVIKREHIASQFESLKSQVNPHFLFNSLNALTALVHKDQDLAVQFIQQLSKVYRYVLDTQKKETVSLKTEIEVLEAYIFLLKIRFGANLNTNLNVPKSEKLFIAPLVLQMLVENAIKHNIVSKSKPLTIDIFIENKNIIIMNKLQIKNNAAEPSGIGLANIKARYQYLIQKEVVITKTEEVFRVEIPLI